MRTKKHSLALALILMLGAGLGSGFAAKPSISGLKLGKDKAMSEETDTFESEDKIFAAAQISGVAGKVGVKAGLFVDDIPGEQKGPIPGLEAIVTLERSGSANFNFSAPTKGWPKGTYVLHVVLLNENGDEVDKRDARFSVE